MARSRLFNLIEHITATENRYILMDTLEGAGQTRDLVHDSTEWFSWLETLPSFHFQGKQGSFTARKDHKQRGHGYWYAYRKHQRKLYIRYLGTTEKLTLARMEQVAAELEVILLHNSK